MDDIISRQTVLDAIDEISREVDDGDGFDYAKWREYFCELPSVLGTNLASLGTDCISRRQAIEAICNACGKIDCDKMDKCEKLQLPPANCSEFPNNSDTISRQAAIDAMNGLPKYNDNGVCLDYEDVIAVLSEHLPSAQPEIIVCEDCKWRISKNRKTTSLWLPCRALVTPDQFSCIYAERREVTT